MNLSPLMRLWATLASALSLRRLINANKCQRALASAAAAAMVLAISWLAGWLAHSACVVSLASSGSSSKGSSTNWRRTGKADQAASSSAPAARRVQTAAG